MSRSFAILVEPAQSGGAAPGPVVPVARSLRESGAEVEVTYSPGPRAVDRLVADAVARGTVVLAVGGEVFVAEVAEVVARYGGRLEVSRTSTPSARRRLYPLDLQLPGAPRDARARRWLAVHLPRPASFRPH